jgi:hypothetical protein
MKNSIYTSGSMEYNDKCLVWRKEMNRKLHYWYKIIIPDPTPCPFDKEDEEYSKWVREHFIMPDMHDVATSRHFFVLLDPAVFKGAGTISELSLACWLGKEIVYMLDGIEKKDIPGWVIGCLTGAKQVSSIEEAIEYYKNSVKI